MKTFILIALCISIFLTLTNCSEGGIFNCVCTERACSSNTNPTITCTLNATNYPEIQIDSVKDILVIQTDAAFNPIDSLNLEFAPIAFGSNQYTLNIGAPNSGFGNELLFSNLIIHNKGINQIDTIAQIQYQVIETEEFCNSCSGGPSCEDETYTLRTFDSPTIRYNSVLINSFNIVYEIK